MFLSKLFNRSGFRLSVIVACILFQQSAEAQNWTGNVNSDWNNSANWSVWPLNGEDILIDPVNYTGVAASPIISSNSVFVPDGVVVQNGAQLTVAANLTANARIELMGANTKLTLNSGTVFAAAGGSKGRFIVADGASVVMNGGTLKAAQRVIVETGARFELKAGIIDAGEELAIGDGNADGSSLFLMSGGSIITGGLGFENEAGTFYPTFIMTAGSLGVNGDVSWLGESPGAGTPRFIMKGGTAVINGDILNDPTSTVNLFMHLEGTAHLTFRGSLINQALAGDSISQSGGVFKIENSVGWSNHGVFKAENSRMEIGGKTTLQGSGVFEFASVEIKTAAILDHMFPAQISMSGDLVNRGLFVHNSNTVLFNGSQSQAITGSTSTVFQNVVLENSSANGVSLGKGITVAGHLQLNLGKLNTMDAAMLVLPDNATTSPGSGVSYVNGPMTKIGDDAFVFPLGGKNAWRRLAITAPSSVQSEFVASYQRDPAPDNLLFNTPLKAVSNVEYWSLNGTNSAAVQVSLYWEDAASSIIGSCSMLSLAHWTGTAWETLPATTAGTCTAHGNGSLTSNNTLSTFGLFTFGFTGKINHQSAVICHGDSLLVGSDFYKTSGTYVDVFIASDLSDSAVFTHLNVLPPPQSLSVFNLCYGEELQFGNRTYTVSGNYIDTVKSLNGCDSIVNMILLIEPEIDVSVTQNSQELMAVFGATAYQWIDCSTGSPLDGETGSTFVAGANGSYAVIVTSNGCSDTSDCYAVTTVSMSKAPKDLARVFPNPNQGVFTLELPFEAELTLSDMTGRSLLNEHLSEGSNMLDYSFLPNGIYFLDIANTSGRVSIKVVKY